MLTVFLDPIYGEWRGLLELARTGIIFKSIIRFPIATRLNGDSACVAGRKQPISLKPVTGLPRN